MGLFQVMTGSANGVLNVLARRAGSLAALVDRTLCGNPVERAIFAFISRTVARSRQHRLILPIYAGMGLAYVFSQAAYVLYHYRTLTARSKTCQGRRI